MTPEQGLALSEYALVGFVVCMGAEQACLIRVDKAYSQKNHKVQSLPFNTWWQYDWLQRLGWVPSLFAYKFSKDLEVSDSEMRWLHGVASLEAASHWRAEKLLERKNT